MDADSSYGGSDTAQDSTSQENTNTSEGHTQDDPSDITIISHNDSTNTSAFHMVKTPPPPASDEPANQYYHKNEISLPVINYDQVDFSNTKLELRPASPKQPHYLSTANLNINDTLENHSNLEQLNKTYNSSSRLNTPNIRKKSIAGIQNPAYIPDDDDDLDKTEVPKSTFDDKKPYNNGDLNTSVALGLKSPTKDETHEEMQPEAVNLELVNMKPLVGGNGNTHENGATGTSIPVKKQTEVDISEPYDEYFVPVNEHRKYMRGEKLYVTMDKRSKKGCGKCFCWGICLAVLIAAIIIGILAATGVILSNEAQPVTEVSVSSRQFSGSGVKTAGIFGVAESPTETTIEPDPNKTSAITNGPSSSTISSMLPTTETSMIQVPRAIEGQIIIDNEEFMPGLAIQNSSEFRELASKLETELMNALFDQYTQNYGSADITVKVTDFSPGSIVVKYRIGWVFKDGIHNARDPIDEQTLKIKLENVLNQNSGYIDEFHVPHSTIIASKVLDMCQIDKNECEHACEFDYKMMDFICICPEGQTLDVAGKTCVDSLHYHELEPNAEPTSEPTTMHIVHNHNHMVEPTPEPNAEPTTMHNAHNHNHMVEPNAEPTSEPNAEPTIMHTAHNHNHMVDPTAEPTTEPTQSHEHHYPSFETTTQRDPSAYDFEHDPLYQPTTVSEPSAEPNTEPTPKQKDVFMGRAHMDPGTESELSSTTGSQQYVQPLFISSTTSEPTAEPTVEPAAEPTSEPNAKLTAQPSANLNIEPIAEPTSEPDAEPTSEPVAEPTSEPVAEPTSEPVAEPTAAPVAEPTSEPEAEPTDKLSVEPIAEPTAEPTSEPSAEPTAEPTSEPTSEPAAEPASEPAAEPASEPAAEPTSEPAAEPTSEPTAEPTSEPAAEPTSEPAAEPSISIQKESVIEPNAEPTSEPSAGLSVEFTTESIAEPTTEPAAEPSSKLSIKPFVEHTSEPAAEPTSEPTAEPNVKITGKLSVEPLSTAEPKTEPNVETTSQPTSEPNAEPTAEPSAESTTDSHVMHTNKIPLIHTAESYTEPNTTPSAEPSAEPSVEPSVEPAAEPIAEPTAEPTSEPTAEPTSEPAAEPITNILIEPTEKPSSEVSAEPTTELSAAEPISHVHNIYIHETHLEQTTLSNEPTEETTVTSDSESKTVKPENELSSNELTTTPAIHLYRVHEVTQELNKPNTPADNQYHTSEKYNYILDQQYQTTRTNFITEFTTPVPHYIQELINQINSTETPPRTIIDTIAQNENEQNAQTTMRNLEQNDSRANHVYEVYETNSEQEPLSRPETTTEAIQTLLTEDSSEENNALSVVPLGKNIRFNDYNSTTNNKTKIEETTVNSLSTNEIHTTDHFRDVMVERGRKLDSSSEYYIHNNQQIELFSEAAEITTETSDTQTEATGTDMTKIFSEIHKILDQNEQTTSSMMQETTNYVTHRPSEDGYTVFPTLPPRLDNDEKNETNPIENNTETNNTFSVQDTSTENLNEIIANSIIDRQINNSTLEVTTELERSESNSEQPHLTTTERLTMLENQTIVPIYGETIETVTQTVKILPENNESNTDYNDLLAASTENIGNAVPNYTTQNVSDSQSNISNTTDRNMSDMQRDNTTSLITTRFLSSELTTDQNILTTILPVSGINATETYVDHTENANSILNTVEDHIKIAPVTEENDLSVIPLQNANSKIEVNATENTDNDINSDNQINDRITTGDGSTTEKIENNSGEIQMIHIEPSSTELNNKTENMFPIVAPDFRTFSKCASGQFQCANGTSIKDGSYCIARNAKCDSVDDCSDGSDEIGCLEESCLDNFQCKSGQCLKRHQVCDGIVNCNDGTDEEACETWECKFDEFSCGAGGKCIPLTWRCDGRAHCTDGADEQKCLTSHCGNNEFHCTDQDTCIPASWRCDNHPDCLNGEDEKLCECSLEQFKCETGGCINEKQRCDGIDHCPDRSDEWNCVKIDNITEMNRTINAMDTEQSSNISKMFLQIFANDNKWHYVCSDNWNETYSNLACQSLGYADSIYTEHTYSKSIKTNGDYFKIKTSLNKQSKLLTMLEKTESCDNVVSIACHEFTCGNHYTSDLISARFIGGIKATRSQWPSVTLLYNKRLNTQCTGSLVAPTWVLAGYSCVHPQMEPSDWLLYAGGTQFDARLNSSETQVKQVKSITAHPQAKYSQFLYKNDLVLIELSTPVTLGSNVSVICLPERDIEPRQLCVTAGWGISQPGESNLQQYLHYLPVPTIEMDECNSTKHYNGQLESDKICAGYTDSEKSPCYNDEGAPLMCFSDSENTWELQGILSHHGNCGRSHHPAIHTAINKDVRRWIANTVGVRAIMHKRPMFNVKK